MRRREPPEVVYVERGSDSSARWLFWGALLGAGLALLYAPRSGEETRRLLQRRLWKLRAMTEEKLDELSRRFGDRPPEAPTLEDEEDAGDDLPPAAEPVRTAAPSPRQELERRLADARARRRASTADVDVEEPLA